MTTAATVANSIKAEIANDIRRCAPAHTRITLDVALANWQYFFQDGRTTEAKVWWSIVHEFITGAR